MIFGSGLPPTKRPRLRSSRSKATPSRNAMPTAARWPCAAPSSLSSRRLGLIIASASGSADGALVMVADDHVEPGGLGLAERIERLRPAIDGDDEIDPAILQPDQRASARAIAFHQAVGDVGDRIGAEAAQQQDQQRRAGRAVDVIIAENGDRSRRLSIASARRDAALSMSRNTEGSGRKSRIVGERWRARSSRGTPRASKELVGEVVGKRVATLPSPAPRLAGKRSGDVERLVHA